MSTKNITPYQTSLQASAGFPPAPPEAHHPAGEGQTAIHGLKIGDVFFEFTEIDVMRVSKARPGQATPNDFRCLAIRVKSPPGGTT